ncbi:MAG TPA: DUF1376 domain-containing protein [Gemmatimonadaceae bacterium]|jgi:uncharacterized protein YdaU (DUF1376 family)
MPNQLHWFPLDPEKWLARTARLGPEERAAYDYLRCHAWLSHDRGELPCSLPDADEELERMAGVGMAWKKVRARVRAMFELRDGRLVDVNLLEQWKEQHEKYARRVLAGSKGGKAKGKRTKQSDSNARPMLEQSDSNALAKGKQPELEPEEAVDQTLKGLDLPASAPNGALALDAARTPGANGDEHDNDLASPERWHELMAAISPERALVRAVNDSAEHSVSAVASAEAWFALHPELHDSLEHQVNAWPAHSETGRNRVRLGLVVRAWQTAGSPEPEASLA